MRSFSPNISRSGDTVSNAQADSGWAGMIGRRFRKPERHAAAELQVRGIRISQRTPLPPGSAIARPYRRSSCRDTGRELRWSRRVSGGGATLWP